MPARHRSAPVVYRCTGGGRCPEANVRVSKCPTFHHNEMLAHVSRLIAFTCTCGRWAVPRLTLTVQRNVAVCPTDTLTLLGYGAISDVLDSLLSTTASIR